MKRSKIEQPPQAVIDWVNDHKGFRVPAFAPGKYESYAEGKTAACWGSHGGIRVNAEFSVAVCQPSPVRGQAATPIWFDFKRTVKLK